MSTDHSEGWDRIADQFIAARSTVGADLVLGWAQEILPPSSRILDVGCGSGMPIASTLVEAGFEVAGVDASPRLIAAFRRHFPHAPSACEAAQDSLFFGRTFDAAIAIGLLFLLSEDDQASVIQRVAKALRPDGHFLFSAPRERCEWRDILTGRPSRSLGDEAYGHVLDAAGLVLVGFHKDEGGNHYFDAAKPPR